MADNVAQQIKNLSDEIARLDKGLENTKALADKIFENSKDIGDALQKSFRKGDDAAKGTTAALKELLKTITDNFGNGKELKLAIGIEKNKLRHEIAKAEDEIRQSGEKNNLKQINAIKKYKQQLAQLADFERTFADINKVINGDKSSNASKEWLERTALSTKEKKALDDATNGYIKQTQAIQDLNRTLDELRQKRAAAEALPVTGVGKKGVSYKTDLSKQSVLGKIDKEIEATETKINNATTAAQKFQAQLIAMQGEKKTKAMSRALGIEEAEADMQKVPTAFDRVIEQINQRAAQSKDKFAKQLVNAEQIKNAAQNAAMEASAIFKKIQNSTYSPGFINELVLGRRDIIKQGLGVFKDEDVSPALKRYIESLRAISNLQEQIEQSQRKYTANQSAIEGVTRRFNETEQAITKVRERWEELNVKKQAGLINEKDFKDSTQKLIDEYDRLIKKRQEFEVKDIGQMSFERERARIEAEERYARIRRENAKARTQDEINAEKAIAAERAKRARALASTDANMNAAVNKQIQYQRQLNTLRKEYNLLNDKKTRTTEENAILEQTKKKIKEIISLSKQLNNEQKGSHNLAVQITNYDRLKQKIHEANKETKEHKTSLESMIPTLQRLASAFGVAFSVQGLVQFGKKLVETRGEFEMQFVAMKSIIGDVDAATKIWNQTLQQSLQSPKTFKELTKYTKQLAAYRIETDKLFDTTKRLADVSAGLGVDMGRLILAYGQVKAANYLRASEVRQFTEAGVNIYGELARYFSEIEGRAVGTAEVVERVTKRMVLFSDVEKIFQRMTDEGGTFFNMQEIQADTVLGQINKLHDAYDQMLNTIGQANQGTIRNLLETLNDLVRNWQNVAFVLKGNVNWITLIGAALYALSRNYLKGATTQTLWFSKAIMGNSKALLKNTEDVRIFSRVIGDYTLKQRLAIVATRTLQGALSKLWSVAKAALPFLVFEGAVILIERLTRASRELKRFREELESVTSENVGRMNEEISGYDALVKKLQKTNEGTAARKEILDEISSRYGKYLDFIVTEKTTVEELAGAYDNVVSSIRNYTAEKIREEQQQKLEKGIYDEYQDLVDSLTGKRIADAQGKQFKITKEQAKNIAKLIQQSLDVYGVVDIQQILETYFGKALGLTSAGGNNTGIGNLIRSYIGEYNSLKSELQEIRNDIEGETPVFSSDAEYNDYVKRVQAANAALAEQAKKNEQIIDSIKKKTRTESDSWKIEDEISAQRIKNSEEELRIRKQYGLLTEQQYKDALKRLHGELDSYETDYNARLAKALSDQYGKTWKTSNKEARDMYNYVVSTEDALQQGTLQRNKQLVESYKGLKESLKEYKEQLSAAQKTGAGEDAVKKIQSDIDWATLMMKAIELAAQLRGLDLTDKKKGRTAHNYDSISSLISLLKEMNSEYDKLSKSAYGFAKSNEKVVESFTPAFKEIFGFAGINISQVDTTSKRATADAMKLVIDTLDKKNLWGKFGSDGGKKARKEFVKAWSQENVEADIDVQVRIREDFGRQMEEAFGNYELTLELEKLNLPKGLAADMWGIEEVDLSQLRGKLDELFQGLKDAKGEVAADSLKAYEGYLKKIDDLEQKQQRERLKDYAKYIEAQYSDRVKLEMDYVRKVAKLEAETAISPEQRAAIRAGIDKEYNEAVKKQDWEDFKGSEFYVQMMEDLEKQGTASLEVMREKLEEMRKNAENLTPRALKEVVSSLEKIDEIERGRTAPLQRLKKALDDLGDTNMSEVYKSLSANQKQLSVQEEQKRQLEEMIMLENERNRLQEQGVTIEEAQVKLSQKQAEEALAQKALSSFADDGSDDSRKILLSLEQAVNRAKGEREAAELVVQILSGQKEIALAAEGNQYTGKSITELNAEKKALEEQIKNTNNNISAQQELVRIAKALQQAWYDTFESIKDYAQRIGGIFDGVTETIDYFADSTNSLAAEWREFGNTAVSALSDLVSGIQAYKDAKDKAEKGDAAAGLMSGNMLKLALIILGVIIKIIQAIAKFQDSAIDKEIERSRQRVDELSRAYERLERSIEKTFKTADYMANYNEQMQNLREQLAAAEAQISAASQYKDEDKKRDALNSARDAKDQVLDMMDEIEQRQLETFGGIGKDNYRSWAEGFVDAWKDAFLETGDGLDALQDHFDEFLQEWFVKQATMRIAGKALEGVMGDIDKVVSDNGVVDWAELQRIKDQMDLILPDLNDKLTAFAGMWDFGGEGGLSGLAAGIQGMTEEQANVLEAYWNSVRMYAASIDGNVSRIAEMLGANGVESNPMLQQMSLIAANTQATHQLLQTVVKSGHPQGGYGVKVFND